MVQHNEKPWLISYPEDVQPEEEQTPTQAIEEKPAEPIKEPIKEPVRTVPVQLSFDF